MEKKVYFQNSKGDRLCGIINDPTGDKNRPIIIIAHGFSSNKYSRNNVRLSELLNKNSLSTLRIDIWGHGESEGKFEDITITEAVDDILQAIRFVKKLGYKRIGLVGSSFGGISSIIAASKSKDLFLLALKSPVSNYKEKEMMTKSKEMLEDWKRKGYRYYVNNKGEKLRLNYSFYKDFDNNNGYKTAPNIQIPTLIVHGDADQTVSVSQSIKISKLIPNCRLVLIKGANHVYTKPTHTEQMLQTISNFIIEESSRRYVTVKQLTVTY